MWWSTTSAATSGSRRDPIRPRMPPAPLLRAFEIAAPQTASRVARVTLGLEIGAAAAAGIECQAVAHQRLAEIVDPARRADGEGAAIAVVPAWRAGEVAAQAERCQPVARRGAARPGGALRVLADLPQLRRIDVVQAERLAAAAKRVAVDDGDPEPGACARVVDRAERPHRADRGHDDKREHRRAEPPLLRALGRCAARLPRPGRGHRAHTGGG